MCYLGNNENTLSSEALKNIYELVATYLLKKARERLDPTLPVLPPTLKTEDTVLIETFDPVYVGDYHVVSIKGN